MEFISIIVTYQPEPGTINLIAELLAQSSQVIVVDNGSDNERIKKLQEHFYSENTVFFILNESNVGIATALNQGLRSAKKKGYQWAFTFDQDSRINEKFILEMILTKENVDIISKDGKKKASMIGANQIDCSDKDNRIKFIKFSNSKWKYIIPEKDCEVSILISSGCYINLDIWESQGCFMDNLFIDQVDTEYCIRSLVNGYNIYVSNNAMLYHKLGDQSKGSFLGRDVRPTNHNGIRRYYMIRNSIYLYKKYIREKPIWVIFDINNNIKMLIKLVLFEDQRLHKLSLMMQGLVDGIKNKMGKIPR
ncbi:glycosyltransferase family 2 protein [Tatumella citrea]|uniref:Glycosyltransferase 2-like domain-containing protein n=1 Tax=Tatumella citrea TaxID=53336 RepID=A0A1Y0L4Z2_TATCI|nr:glycosyltransferase family 2 protein [Tatumella citrea]ARU93083.1 hypothetical protein A7K98_04275 [Tatumella citrea]ARU97121.1 hypothetical protein A7K99_04275 [Tatumella citrea]